MLQVNVKPFASDCLEEAMALAQIKALNSFTYSDCLNYLNYAWSDIYSRIAGLDMYQHVLRFSLLIIIETLKSMQTMKKKEIIFMVYINLLALMIILEQQNINKELLIMSIQVMKVNG